MAGRTEIAESPHSLAVVDEETELLFQQRGCCYWLPCTGSARQATRSSIFPGEWWQRVKTAADEPENEQKWWVKGWNALKKVKELSEVVAGPRWKTFIRRFNRNSRNRFGKYNYDPMSYALNFDEGAQQEAEYSYGDFSARFATPVAGKAGKDSRETAPIFTTEQR